MSDKSFHPEREDVQHAMKLLLNTPSDHSSFPELTERLPEAGIGEQATLNLLAPLVLGGAARLGEKTALAHMDPPTPWITWMTQCWNASLNQNLLHPDVSPVAGELEDRVVQWMCPFFGMTGGHLTPGSTVSNLTALWAARDVAKVRKVITSQAAHVSVAKAANILGLELIRVPVNEQGQLDSSQLPSDIGDAALVLTAGTTSEGAIDNLTLAGRAAWTHVDAAWAGPLRFSKKYAHVLSGIEQADSIAISAHKWLFQPKESALILFRDVESANRVLSSSGSYLAKPNIGLLGSHAATAVPLLATLIAWGRSGLAQRIELAMATADELIAFLNQQSNVQVFSGNVCGVILWRSLEHDTTSIIKGLPQGAASSTMIGEQQWIRHVCANPNVEINKLLTAIDLLLTKGAYKGC